MNRVSALVRDIALTHHNRILLLYTTDNARRYTEGQKYVTYWT